MRSSMLHLVCNALPLQGLALKQIVRYFAGLERSSLFGGAAGESPPRWACQFLEAACSVATVGPASHRSDAISGWLALRKAHTLAEGDTSI